MVACKSLGLEFDKKGEIGLWCSIMEEEEVIEEGLVLIHYRIFVE
jgi:hypothetical protein